MGDQVSHRKIPTAKSGGFVEIMNTTLLVLLASIDEYLKKCFTMSYQIVPKGAGPGQNAQLSVPF